MRYKAPDGDEFLNKEMYDEYVLYVRNMRRNIASTTKTPEQIAQARKTAYLKRKLLLLKRKK